MDASVGFLLDSLKHLLLYQANLISGAKAELEELTEELARFKVILEAASAKYKKDLFFEQWESRIREAVSDIEDTVDTSVTQASAVNKTWFKKVFNVSDTISLAEQVKTRRQKVKVLMGEFKDQQDQFTVADGTDPVLDNARKARQQKSQHIVGLEKETELFVKLLTGESDKLEVSSIIGMAGLGKTTFAWKVFEDSKIDLDFAIRIWVNVSENLKIRKILLDILSKFTAATPDASVPDDDLIRTVKGHLENKKFLIVMDDIWTISAWKELEAILPTNNKKGRVLITTRHKDVGNKASNREAYDLRFLNSTESWELLRYKAFGKLEDVPQELTDVGRDIANDCRGLPLSIVVIGGILEEKTSRSGNNITAIKKEWEDVSGRVKVYLVEEGTNGLLRSIISLSYDKLPYAVKNCFLYLGVFPEDADIHVKKLIRLWIAEGLIQESRGHRMEEVAHNYLKDLIQRNLVMVRKVKPDGEAKVCQIHDSIREICKREGGKLNLFQEIRDSEPHMNIRKIRRLCIHSHVRDFFSSELEKPKLPNARSFLCLSDSPMTLEVKETTYITDAFGLLRVYDARCMKFRKFPAKLVQQLNHLRYLTLAVASEFKILPEAVTNLWNLQTLLVDTPSQTLEIKGDIWKMRHLRHFKTRASITLKKKGENTGNKILQTLGRLSPESCTDEVCKKALGLLTLGIQGDLRTLGESTRLKHMVSLNKLKLVHQVSSGVAENPWKDLPRSDGFPPNLKILVLSGTHLNWKEMSVFSKISSLEVLKLKEKAFVGNSWTVEDSGFAELVWLHIERADLRHWRIDNKGYFPKLKFLYINKCDKLSEIPPTLGESLEVLSVERVTPEAVTCARNISNQNTGIKLEIAATDNRHQ